MNHDPRQSTPSPAYVMWPLGRDVPAGVAHAGVVGRHCATHQTVSAVTDMRAMFYGAAAFNQLSERK